jgi:hypothetical protein
MIFWFFPVAGLVAGALAQLAKLQGFPSVEAAATALIEALRHDDDKPAG